MRDVLMFIVLMGLLVTTVSSECWGQDSTHNKKDSLNIKEKYKRLPDSTKIQREELQKFKKAFEKVIREKKLKQKKEVKKDPTLNIGTIIVDHTLSRMGENFYRLFYQKWQSVNIKNSHNSIITLSERPLPGLGSLLTIKIGYQKVYSARLQPRYQYIKALSQQAVARCQNVIKQQALVSKQLSGY